jgi:phosphate transport system permease protein
MFPAKRVSMMRNSAEIRNPSAPARRQPNLLLGRGAGIKRRLVSWTGQAFLLTVTVCSSFAVLFIFYFILKDAIPFFKLRSFTEFLTSPKWFPSREPAEFGALAIFAGSALVTLGAAVFTVPMGVAAAVCLSDVLPFRLRQAIKPVIETLAAIPSVAYGFFALVVLAPLLQDHGGQLLSVAVWLMGAPMGALAVIIVADVAAGRVSGAIPKAYFPVRWGTMAALSVGSFVCLWWLSAKLGRLEIASGANALNVSIILGIMALPTVVSVSEDALQAVGRELREASYALGATRAETVVRVVIPASSSGILAAVILGVMRAMGETMVVWMASGNSAKIPSPWYNFLEPVRTLTAAIAGDMGEADHVTGSARYHVLFAMAACLLAICFAANLASEWAMRRARRKLAGG